MKIKHLLETMKTVPDSTARGWFLQDGGDPDPDWIGETSESYSAGGVEWNLHYVENIKAGEKYVFAVMENYEDPKASSSQLISGTVKTFEREISPDTHELIEQIAERMNDDLMSQKLDQRDNSAKIAAIKRVYLLHIIDLEV